MKDHYYTKYLQKRKQKGLSRHLEILAGQWIDFTHNDYLCLSSHPAVIEGGIKAAEQYGAGGRASRLVLKDVSFYAELETMIARSKGTEAALVFSSGYQTNAAVISALLDQKVLGAEPLVFCDRLNHASMHHGCALAGVKQIRYRNADLDHLTEQLEKCVQDDRPKFILTESVFSMDGTIVDGERLKNLGQQHNAFLYVDEAHATGLFGEKGYGLAKNCDIAMGTFSKALGVSGGYIACSQTTRDYLINTAKGFIYSTAPSPFTIGAVMTAWQLLPSLSEERKRVLGTAQKLRERLHDMGFETGGSQSQIVPVIIGDDQDTLALQNYFQEKGVLVSAIRPPTVPTGTARLRLSLNAGHTDRDIEMLLSCFASWKEKKVA